VFPKILIVILIPDFKLRIRAQQDNRKAIEEKEIPSPARLTALKTVG
jgi:hypothetical protein